MPDFEPQDPAWEAHVRASFARQRLMTTLNAELLESDSRAMRHSFDLPRGLGTAARLFPRRGRFSIGDSACGYAAYTLFPPDVDVLTAEFKINLLAPAVGRELVANGGGHPHWASLKRMPRAYRSGSRDRRRSRLRDHARHHRSRAFQLAELALQDLDNAVRGRNPD